VVPKTQTRVGEGGNCFATALASICETPIPEFGQGVDYWQRVRAYLAKQGLVYRRVPLVRPPAGWATLEGVSPRGGLHATVAYNGEFRHDPHPVADDPRRGLKEPQYYGELMPLDKYRERLHRALDAAMDGGTYRPGMKFKSAEWTSDSVGVIKESSLNNGMLKVEVHTPLDAFVGVGLEAWTVADADKLLKPYSGPMPVPKGRMRDRGL
jgi:hypothetical protein